MQGLKYHLFCLPVLKYCEDRDALQSAVIDPQNTQFFAGTDSAPHSQAAKESACGCAGIYSAHSAVELYAEAFEQIDRLENFEAFMSLNGPAFYQLPKNSGSISLQKKEWKLPQALPYPAGSLIPFKAGQTLQWKLLNHA